MTAVHVSIVDVLDILPKAYVQLLVARERLRLVELVFALLDLLFQLLDLIADRAMVHDGCELLIYSLKLGNEPARANRADIRDLWPEIVDNYGLFLSRSRF